MGVIVLTVVSAVVYAVLQMVTFVVCLVCKILVGLFCLFPNLFGDKSCYPRLAEAPIPNGVERSTVSSQPDGEVAISTKEALIEATKFPSALVRGPAPVQIPDFTAEENESAQRAVNGLCGCREGQIGVVSTFLMFLVLRVRLAGRRHIDRRAFMLGGVIAFLGGLVGKALGMLANRMRIRALVQVGR